MGVGVGAMPTVPGGRQPWVWQVQPRGKFLGNVPEQGNEAVLGWGSSGDSIAGCRQDEVWRMVP